MPVTLSDAGIELPRELVQSVFANARTTSVVGTLSQATPLTLGGSTQPVFNNGINLGVTTEGGRKPVQKADASARHITPVKVAALVPVSDEMVRANPGGMLELIQADLSDGVARALDALALHGSDPITGNRLAGQTALLDTNHVVTLADGDYKSAVLSGFDLVGENYDVNGIAADSRTKARLLAAVNETALGFPNLAAQQFSIAGVPTAFSRTVGRVGNQDKDSRLIVGDWSKIAYGFATGIEVTSSNQATFTDENGEIVSAFERNLTILRVETFIGVTVLQDDAFAVVNAEA